MIIDGGAGEGAGNADVARAIHDVVFEHPTGGQTNAMYLVKGQRIIEFDGAGRGA
eukprot:m.50316 g.50316  ORF g.50316 m.50316 type:complete len:55 (+) comp9005_c0_seq1:1865-2029(+)